MNKKALDEEHCLDISLTQQVGGIIYSGYGNAENKLLEIANLGIPVIAVDKPLSTKNISSILIDNRESVYKAVEHVLLNTALIVRKSTDIHYAGSLPKGSHLLWRWSIIFKKRLIKRLCL